MFCVYLTIYVGDNMPPFYIGSSSIERVEKGYRGSVSSIAYKKIWEYELKANPDKFYTYIISIHEDRISAFKEELEYQKKNEVITNDLFINLSYAQPNGFYGRDVKGYKNPMYGRVRKGEQHIGGYNISKALKLFFETESGILLKEKRSLSFIGEKNPMYGKKHTEEWKDMRSNDMIGEKNPMYGRKHSDEVKQRISDINRGRPSPNKGKSMSEEQREKLRKPKSEEHKKKLRNVYYVNGETVENAKLFCLENNLSYICFLRACTNGKKYKNMVITKAE